MRQINITDKWKKSARCVLHHGDCLDLLRALPSGAVDLVLTSPPYCMGKQYDTSTRIDEFIGLIHAVMKDILRVLAPGGSLCWQVGYHVNNNVVLPLDYMIYDALRYYTDLKLRNRIVWTFGHGMHSSRRFSGRHETMLWFSKGDGYTFDLDAVRVLQKYPGKRHYKGAKRGEFSGNPRGKNPSDVWEIPNVKANHIEKTDHPCQFPVALARRVISALSKEGGWVLDPFMGSGSTAVASLSLNRRFAGAEIDKRYARVTRARVKGLASGATRFRPEHRQIYEPKSNTSLTTLPANWAQNLSSNGTCRRD